MRNRVRKTKAMQYLEYAELAVGGVGVGGVGGFLAVHHTAPAPLVLAAVSCGLLSGVVMRLRSREERKLIDGLVAQSPRPELAQLLGRLSQMLAEWIHGASLVFELLALAFLVTTQPALWNNNLDRMIAFLLIYMISLSVVHLAFACAAGARTEVQSPGG